MAGESGWGVFEFKSMFFLTYFTQKKTKKHPSNFNKPIFQLKTPLNWFKKHKIKQKRNLSRA
jgi:hypothetical protein